MPPVPPETALAAVARIIPQSGAAVLIIGGTNWTLVTPARLTLAASGTRCSSIGWGMSVSSSPSVAAAISVKRVSTVAGSAWSSRAANTHFCRFIRA